MPTFDQRAGETPAPMQVFKEILNQTGKTLKYLHVNFMRDSIWKVDVEKWIKAFYERVSDPKAFLTLNGPGSSWWTNTNLGLSKNKNDDLDEFEDLKGIKNFLERIKKTYPNVTLTPEVDYIEESWIIHIVNQCCERAQLGLLKELYDQGKPLTKKSKRIVKKYIQDPSYELGAH